MRYVVLDTNCLVQILPSRSLYHRIWTDFLEGKYCLCVSNEILMEYEEILSIHASPEVAQNVVEAIARHPKTHYQESYYHFHLLSDVDKDDNKFVDCGLIDILGGKIFWKARKYLSLWRFSLIW